MLVFCDHGDQQLDGVDFFEIYAPVLKCSTIRLMLILEVLLELESKQGNVLVVFIHANVEEGGKKMLKFPEVLEEK